MLNKPDPFNLANSSKWRSRYASLDRESREVQVITLEGMGRNVFVTVWWKAWKTRPWQMKAEEDLAVDNVIMSAK